MKRARRTQGGVSVRVKGKNITITPELHDLTVHKMARLDKYHDRLSEIEVVLWTEKTRESAHQNHVEATAYILGRTMRVTAENSEMYAALDDAIDKLYRQLNRHKERLKGHHGSKRSEVLPGEETIAPDEPLLDDLAADNGRGPDIRIERLSVKPQFEDEAIEEMDALGRIFYVFLNARNEQVNVVYRRADGAYGLIEPTVE
jgi:putative sigma-54 modulation protein